MTFYYCSFCGQGNQEVEVMIAGPNANMCSDCVELSTEIIKQRRKDKMSEEEKKGMCAEEKNYLILQEEKQRTVDQLAHMKHTEDENFKQHIEQIKGRNFANRKYDNHVFYTNVCNLVQTCILLLTFCAIVLALVYGG